jgi:hypothetical protein
MNDVFCWINSRVVGHAMKPIGDHVARHNGRRLANQQETRRMISTRKTRKTTTERVGPQHSSRGPICLPGMF